MPGFSSITKLGRRLIQKGMRRSIGIKTELKRIISKQSARAATSVAEKGAVAADASIVKTASGIAEKTVAKSGPKLLTNSGEKGLVKYSEAYLSKSESALLKNPNMFKKAAVVDAEIISSTLAKGSARSKYAPWLKKAGKWALGMARDVAIFTGLDYLIDYVFDDDVDPAEGDVQAAAEIAARNAVMNQLKVTDLDNITEDSRRRRSSSSLSSSYTSASSTSELFSIVERLYRDQDVHTSGESLNERLTDEVLDLSANSKALVINALVNVLKFLANHSTSPEFWQSYINQAILTDLDVAAWTESFEALVQSGAIGSTRLESAASVQNETLSAVLKEMRDSSGNELFDSLTDVIEIFESGITTFDRNSVSEETAAAIMPMQLSSLIVPEGLIDIKNFFRRFRIDEKDITDDEYLAVQELSRLITTGTQYLALQRAIAEGNERKIAQLLSIGN